MWVVRTTDVLKMHGPPQVHEELLRAGLLVLRESHFKTIFVSHQWLGAVHPDEDGRQLRILRLCIRNILSGSLKLSPTDFASVGQSTAREQGLSRSELDDLRNSYIWFDWFSIPQHGATKDFALAVQSIPAFVDACEFFVALVPTIPHKSTGMDCSFTSWLDRGWCRAEMWCRLLCSRPTIPIIIVLDHDHAVFATPSQCLPYPPNTGEYTVAKDRVEVNKFIRVALRNKIGLLESRRTTVDIGRYYKARFQDILGLPPADQNPRSFVSHFCFESKEEAINEKAGMGAMACAVLSRNVKMMRWLSRSGAPLTTRLSDMTSVGIPDGWSPLHLAAQVSWHDIGPLQELLSLRANPNLTDAVGVPVLSACSSAEAVHLLVDHRADANLRRSPSFVSALQSSCARFSPIETVAALIKCRAEVHPGELCSLAGAATMQRHEVELAHLLIQSKAQVNARPRNSNRQRLTELACRARLVLTEPSLRVRHLAESSTTALGHACFWGSANLAAFLLGAKANPTEANNRGHTPVQLARHQAVFDVLQSFVEEPHNGIQNHKSDSTPVRSREPGVELRSPVASIELDFWAGRRLEDTGRSANTELHTLSMVPLHSVRHFIEDPTDDSFSV